MYQVLVRNWWKTNPDYPNGLEPDSNATKTILGYFDTETEAWLRCKQYSVNNDPGKLSRKAEFRFIKGEK